MSDRPSSTDHAQPGSSADPTGPPPRPGEAAGNAPSPGLREQLTRTKDAVLGLVAAHVKLAQAELSEIADEVKRAAALVGIALAMLMLAGLMATLGTILWLDEWIFGSIGWGALHGSELFLALTIVPLLMAVELRWQGALGSLLLAGLVGIALAIVFGVDWRQLGDQHLSGLTPGIRPFVLAVPAGAVVLGLIGLIAGSVGGSGGRAAAGLVVGIVLGAILGAIATVGASVHVAIAIGIAVALAFWPVFAAVAVFRDGIDTQRLKDRFLPEETIRTTKETIEWVRAQTPLGPKS